jgi:hypothetical protein
MLNYREIFRLANLNFNNSQIAKSSGIARCSVIKVLKLAKNISLNLDLAKDKSNHEIFNILFKDQASNKDFKIPDFSYISNELKKKGVTLKLLWKENSLSTSFPE